MTKTCFKGKIYSVNIVYLRKCRAKTAFITNHVPFNAEHRTVSVGDVEKNNYFGYSYMQTEQLVENLQSRFKSKRLKATKILGSSTAEKSVLADDKEPSVQFRSVYSGFEYTPSMVAYKAYKTSHFATGLIDYATLNGAKEFIASQKHFNGVYFIGAGIKTEFDGKKVSLQAIGVPHGEITAFSKSLYAARVLKFKHVNLIREKINEKFGKYRLYLPLSLKIFKKAKGLGSEHVYCALAQKICEKFPTEEEIITFLSKELDFNLSEIEINKLSDEASTLYVSDLAEILRAHLGLKDMREKTISAKEFISDAKKHGAIPVAIYDGSNLDVFLSRCKKYGIKGVCLEPDKHDVNPREFYDRVIDCGLLPMARKVLDRPRKKTEFIFDDVETSNLFKESALAVCGHEISASVNLADGLFSEKTIAQLPDLKSRIKLFSKIPSNE